MKRITMTALVLVLLATSAWSKIKKDDQEYFDGQFEQMKAQIKALQDHNKALAEQLAKVDAELTQLQKTQSETVEQMHSDGRYLEEVNQSLRMNQMTHEQDANAMKTILSLLQGVKEQLAAAPAAAAGVATPASVVLVPGTALSQPITGQTPTAPIQSAVAPHVFYIVLIEGGTYTVGAGHAQGVQIGAKLPVYKKNAPTEKIGELQVTDIVDENDCHARVASLSPGSTIEANDIVQLQ